MGRSTLRFGRCTVEPDLRELRLDGRLQDVAPKVFSLLLYLIENADRVVSKEELLARFWPDAEVSESALASAVLKARAAIGDDDAGRRLIRTVRRGGYRFLGETLRADAEPAQAPSPTRAVPVLTKDHHQERPLRVAFLPFENLTGESSSAWIDLGLMSLVRHALEADVRLSMLSVASTLSAIASAGESSAGDKARVLQKTLGADCVVHCEVRLGKHGYRLDYQFFGERARGLSGGHDAASLTQLGHWLAQTIEASLYDGKPVAVPLQFTDPLANEALARALEAHEREQTSVSAKLFEVVLDIEPDHPRVCLLAARGITRADPARAIEIAGALLQRMSETADRHFIAATHHALGHAMLHAGAIEEGERHVQRALELAESLPFDDVVLHIYAANAFAARLRGDQASFARLLQAVESGSRLLGDNAHLAWAQNHLAVSALDAGRLEEARNRLQESLELTRIHHAFATLCSALGSEVVLHVARGDLSAALAACQAATSSLLSCQWNSVLAFEVMRASHTYAEVSDVASIERLLHLARRLEGAKSSRITAPLLVAQALRERCLGQPDDALRLLEQAVSLADDSDVYSARKMLAVLLAAQLHFDRHSEAQATLARIDAMPDERVPPLLRHMATLARAALAHGRGERSTAMSLLHKLVAASPTGRVPGLARLDLAWLQLEAGDLPAADRTLATAGIWMQKHPLGLLVHARREFAAGHGAAAQAACAAALAYYRGPSPPAWIVALQRSFTSMASLDAAVPPLPRLLDLM